MDRIPFHVPTVNERDIPGVVEVLRKGWLTTGPRCREFEAAFASHIGGSPEAIAVNSCTAGLHLALEAVGVTRGDLVITTPWTFTATAEVIRYLGADPLFVDVDESTLNLQPQTVRETILALDDADRTRLKAIVPVHFAGLGLDMAGFAAVAKEFGLRLVDDAAHALPATSNGRNVGRWGDATVFSFYATKTLCTGEGGMILTPHADLAERMRAMRLHGISRDVFDRYTSDKPAWYYEVIAPGFKYNLTDLAAQLGLTQLERIEEFRLAREAIAARYDAAFSGEAGLTTPPQPAPGETHSRHLYPLRLEGGQAVRDQTIEELAKMGISTSVHFIPLHRQPYWRDRYRLEDKDFPIATRAFGEELSLPIYPAMDDRQIDRVCAAVPAARAKAQREFGSRA